MSDDDSWRDTYDDWKLATPPEYDGPLDEPECDHVCFEVNWEGRAVCDDCGALWWATGAQVLAFNAAQRRYERDCARYNRPWRRAWRWVRARLQRPVDGELPF